MYIWVVLATFLAAIASYYLAPRNDMRELTVVPLAEAEIAKVVTQHKAASTYIGHHKRSSGSSLPTYIIGELTENELAPYFPYGHGINDNYATLVYCVDENYSQLYQTPNECFSNSTNIKYLITCGSLPLRWVNLNTGTPTADFMTAMRHSVSADSGLGYTVYHDGSFWIFEHNQTQTEVPPILLDQGGLQDYCGFDEEQAAIVYMNKI